MATSCRLYFYLTGPQKAVIPALAGTHPAYGGKQIG